MDVAALQGAVGLLREGRLEEAERALDALLRDAPEAFAPWHLLGAVRLERGDPGRALEALDAALARQPGHPDALYNRGNALAALLRFEDAIPSYDASLQARPDSAPAWYNRGNALQASGQLAAAVESFQRAIACAPGLKQAHNNLGSVLRAMDRAAEALLHFERAIALDPGYAEAFNNRGLALQDLGRRTEALACLDHAVALAPGRAELQGNRGILLGQLGRGAEAQAALERALAIDPQQPGAWNSLGVELHRKRRIVAALDCYEQALARQPGHADAWNNKGNAMHDLRRMDEALACFETAIRLRPEFAEAFNNRGMVLQDLQCYEKAMADYDRAIALKPAGSEAWQRRAALKLLLGQHRAGRADYEAGIQRSRAASAPSRVKAPYWRGEPLAGKQLLLSEPNGLGDTLQFFRFVPRLVAMGARVTFLGPARFFRILSSFARDVRFITDTGNEHYDYQSLLWSLPHLLDVDEAALAEHLPWLRAEASLVDRWGGTLDRACFNVGICWQGNPERKIDAGRSIPLAAFLPLAQVSGVKLISLQINHGVEQLATLPEGMRVDRLDDGFDAGADAFVDTAALLDSLDLVVTADTSITHVAGSMGRPAWVALNAVPDWRWMLERRDSPWYPSVRLFRQSRRDDWSGVFAGMADALADTVQAWRENTR